MYTCIVIPKHILCLDRQIHNLNFKKSPAAIASTKPMLVFFRLFFVGKIFRGFQPFISPATFTQEIAKV